MAEARPPIPASLARRPVVGGLAAAWVNAELADGGSDFRSPHTARYEQAWRSSWCQSHGGPTGRRAVLVCGPRQVLTLHFDEPPVCPPCAQYAAAGACPFVSGRAVTYPERKRLTEGHRGEKCNDPQCGCGGWRTTDPEHSADMGGQPNLPWYAVWTTPDAYILTAHVITTRCSDLGCEHERILINGANLTQLPLKVQLLSEPGRETTRRTLTAAEALAHAAAAIETAGVKPAERSPMWDGKPFAMPTARQAPAARPAAAPKARKRRLPRDPSAMSLKQLDQYVAEMAAVRMQLKDEARRIGEEIARLDAEGGAS